MKYLIPVAAVVALIILWKTREKEIDYRALNWHITAFSDQEKGGNSQFTTPYDSSSLTLNYFIGTAVDYPYIGCGITAKKESESIDISPYTTIRLELDSSCTDLNVSLNYFIPNHSTIEEGISQWQCMSELAIKKGITTYKIPVKQFAAQQWWYVVNRLNAFDIPKESSKKLCGIYFTNSPQTAHGTAGTIAVRRIVFTRDIRPAAAALFAVLLGWLIIPLAARRFSARMRESSENTTFIPYEKSEIGQSPRHKMHTDRDRLQEFVAVEYKNQAISLEFAEEKLALPQHRIRALAKEISGTGFKEYVTLLRMNEAKRLLSIDSYRIQDVASAVGYLHTSTFNHNFKETTGMTPREFREVHEKENR